MASVRVPPPFLSSPLLGRSVVRKGLPSEMATGGKTIGSTRPFPQRRSAARLDSWSRRGDDDDDLAKWLCRLLEAAGCSKHPMNDTAMAADPSTRASSWPRPSRSSASKTIKLCRPEIKDCAARRLKSPFRSNFIVPRRISGIAAPLERVDANDDDDDAAW